MEIKTGNINLEVLRVHLKSNFSDDYSRNGTARAYPIFESNMPHFEMTNLKREDRIDNIYRTIEWLNVENSLRYTPSNVKTFPNVYAYDLIYILGGYLPRVWWTDQIVDEILNGNNSPVSEYGSTLFELNCNDLFKWFRKYGCHFNWKEISSFDRLQTKVNEIGSLGFIITNKKTENKDGDIAVVIPENKEFACPRMFEKILSPLQTQAGTTNRKIFTNSNWWYQRDFNSKVSFWLWNLPS